MIYANKTDRDTTVWLLTIFHIDLLMFYKLA